MILLKCISRSILTFTVLAIVASSTASALGLSTAVVGGLNQTVSSGGSTGYTAGGRLGFGLGLLDADLSVMFLSRNYSTLSDLGFGNLNFIEIPLVIRYPLLPLLSLGGGGYLDKAITSGAATVYGIRASLQFNPPAAPVFVEGNFDYSLGEGGSGNANDLQLLVGFRF